MNNHYLYFSISHSYVFMFHLNVSFNPIYLEMTPHTSIFCVIQIPHGFLEQVLNVTESNEMESPLGILD